MICAPIEGVLRSGKQLLAERTVVSVVYAKGVENIERIPVFDETGVDGKNGFAVESAVDGGMRPATT